MIDTTEVEDPPVRVPFRPPRRGFVCRDHHNVQVRPNGKGCPLCPKRQDKAARKKAKKTEAADEIGWTQ